MITITLVTLAFATRSNSRWARGFVRVCGRIPGALKAFGKGRRQVEANI